MTLSGRTLTNCARNMSSKSLCPRFLSDVVVFLDRDTLPDMKNMKSKWLSIMSTVKAISAYVHLASTLLSIFFVCCCFSTQAALQPPRAGEQAASHSDCISAAARTQRCGQQDPGDVRHDGRRHRSVCLRGCRSPAGGRRGSDPRCGQGKEGLLHHSQWGGPAQRPLQEK